MAHLTMSELEAGLETITQAPKDNGRLEMIVQRPGVGERNTIEAGELSLEEGLVGDNWKDRPNAHPEMQLNIMNARSTALVAHGRERWTLAGDQLYVDLDLSLENLPAGTQLAIGDAVVEVTAMPHRGCAKFVDRFGADAMTFVNSEVGCQLNLRGINAKVVRGGHIRVGDSLTKLGTSNG
ncbi:MAG: MOSC domain-containing protein [Pseudomonadota bacterium]